MSLHISKQIWTPFWLVHSKIKKPEFFFKLLHGPSIPCVSGIDGPGYPG